LARLRTGPPSPYPVRMYTDLCPAGFLERRTAEERWQLLDVREEWERKIASVAGTIDIPMAEVPRRLNELDRNRPVAVLCHSGGRSAQVAAFLSRHGFDRVANIAGGIDAWSTDVDDSIPRY